ncbi:hypothetical protein V6N12_039542 [Hibiscus sabdariffa]|uniref:Uncharacterized protein n=1 Tax=Hibiscus sabdariffa TaxID=183260 RepID=A0ABR2E0Z3_9ROSI
MRKGKRNPKKVYSETIRIVEKSEYISIGPFIYSIVDPTVFVVVLAVQWAADTRFSFFFTEAFTFSVTDRRFALHFLYSDCGLHFERT